LAELVSLGFWIQGFPADVFSLGMTLVALWASASMDEAPAMKFVWHALHAPAVFLPELSEIYQLAK